VLFMFCICTLPPVGKIHTVLKKPSWPAGKSGGMSGFIQINYLEIFHD